jgi:WD40 repeat protein/class 3 adenylate cyclase
VAGQGPTNAGPVASDAGESGNEIKIFLFADVRGYTRFTQERGDEAAARLAARFAGVARERLEARGGLGIEIAGDEALAVFNSPRQAIRAAVELQARFVEETSADPTLPLRVGIGLDAGEAVPLEGGHRGGALNTAARLCALAAPGEVLASQEVGHLARRVEGVRFLEQGPLRLKGIAQPVQVIKVVEEAANPYKGLRAFEEADAPDYFGRDALIQQIVTRLSEPGEQSRFLAVVGPSGSGKSSVVRAGIVPALRQGALAGATRCLVAVMLPGQEPMKEVAAVLQGIAAVERSGADDLQQGRRGLHSVVDEALPPGSELVLVIDQFEELFTLIEDEAVRAGFLDHIANAVIQPAGRLRCIVTLRADLYDRPLRYKAFGDLVGARTQTVTPLSAEELQRAISGPAERMGVVLEPGLVAQMVADVSDEPGALPLLQFALTELFEQRRGNTMTLDGYRAIGGVSGALARRAESVYGSLDDVQQQTTRQLFLRLTTSVDEAEVARRRVPRPELLSVHVDESAMETAIEAFGNARLLSFDRDPVTGNPTVGVAHEALLVEWARLRGWLEAAREDLRAQRRLAASVREWLDAGREHSFLVAGSRLEQFEGWRESSGLGATPEEREFLEASLSERERRRALERRSVRRLRALVAVLTVAALLAGAMTVFAFTQRGRAQREGRLAAARELAAAAVANLDVDPERSILLAMEAVKRTRSVDGSVLPEAEEALHRAVGASRIVSSFPGAGGDVDWSPKGVFVTEGVEDSGIIDIRDVATGKSVQTFKGHLVDINFVAFSPDGSLLATTGDDDLLKVWNPATGAAVSSHLGVGLAVGPSFSRDGSLVAAAWPDEGIARVVDPVRRREVRTLNLPGANDTAFTPDGKRLAVSSGDESGVAVFDIETGKRAFDLIGHEFPVNDVSWSPDGRDLATASSDGSSKVWDGRSGRLRFTLSGHTGTVSSVDWSPDSSRVITGGSDGTGRVWEITEGGARQVQVLSAQGLSGGVVARFSPDGTKVMTGDVGVTNVKIWDVGLSGDAEWANLPVQELWPGDVRFSPDGRQVVATGGRDSVTVWDLATGKAVRTSRPDPAQDPPGFEFQSWDLSPDGTSIVAAGLDGTARAWDTATGKELSRVVPHEQEPTDVNWSPDGSHLVVGSFDGTTKIVDRSGREARVLKDDQDFYVASVRFSPDGRLVATSAVPKRGNPDYHVRIWDWQRNTVIRQIDTAAEVSVFDPSGSRIATAAPRGDARVWDVESGAELATLAGHTGGINDLAFSPDGARIATVGFDGNVRLFDAASGQLLLMLRGHTLGVFSVTFSPDGTKLASESADGTARIWALDLNDLIEIATDELTRGLTTDECRQYLHLPRCPPG